MDVWCRLAARRPRSSARPYSGTPVEVPSALLDDSRRIAACESDT